MSRGCLDVDRIPTPPSGEGEMHVNLHRGQQQAMLSKARFPVILAGTQVGKTCFLPDWLMNEIENKGEGDYIALTSTFKLLELKLLPEMRNFFCEIKINGSTWGKYRDSDNVIVSHNGKSRIIFASAVNPESIESATAKAAIWDEAGQKECRLQTWEALQRRLSLNLGRCLLATTLYQLGWLKTEVYDRWRNGDKNFEVFQFDSTMNPAFPKEEYERMKGIMPGWKFDMFYRGRYAKPAGMVYDSFDDNACVVDRFPIPRNWPVYVGHDFGSANPAALFIAQNPESGDLFIFKEYLPGTGRSTADHVQEFKGIVAGYNVLRRVGGNQTTEDEIRQGYTAHGWPIIAPKIKSVVEQVNKVYAQAE
jgi:hypothetical protein